VKTKRLLSPFDLNRPENIIKGFLYPNVEANQIDSFLEIKTEKEWRVGMVVYIGMEISENDVFAEIVDSGKKIESVEHLLHNIEEYLRQVNKFKIGDIIGIKPMKESFELIKLEKPPRPKSKLP
jgi:hypothetical protein